MKKLTSLFSTAGAFVGATVMSSAAFAQTRPVHFNIGNMIGDNELNDLKTTAISIITALVAVAFVLLIGRAIIRALQIRP